MAAYDQPAARRQEHLELAWNDVVKYDHHHFDSDAQGIYVVYGIIPEIPCRQERFYVLLPDLRVANNPAPYKKFTVCQTLIDRYGKKLVRDG